MHEVGPQAVAAEEFGRQGISCRRIFGNTPKDERDAILAAFKRGEIRALASMGVLTTGFNAPAVDLIALLRPTQSARRSLPSHVGSPAAMSNAPIIRSCAKPLGAVRLALLPSARTAHPPSGKPNPVALSATAPW